jgi:hypothetical protein
MDIDKESGGLLSSLEKEEDSKTKNEMTSYTNLLSRPTSTIGERYFSKSEITKLINHTENAVRKILRNPKRSGEEKSDAKSVLSWIQSVKDTWKDEGSLHPNVVTKLMKTSAGIGSGRFGFMSKGWTSRGDGKVPSNFAR